MAELRDYVMRSALRRVTGKFLECKAGLRQRQDKKSPEAEALYKEEKDDAYRTENETRFKAKNSTLRKVLT